MEITFITPEMDFRQAGDSKGGYVEFTKCTLKTARKGDRISIFCPKIKDGDKNYTIKSGVIESHTHNKHKDEYRITYTDWRDQSVYKAYLAYKSNMWYTILSRSREMREENEIAELHLDQIFAFK
jgi:hypothetical protein